MRLYGFDGVNHFHACHDFAKHGIATAIGIQRWVVHHVDEELRRRGVQGSSACHGNGAARVAQAIANLKLDGRAGWRFQQRRIEASALDHKIANNTVENFVFVKPVAHVLQKVGNGGRSVGGVQLHH